MEIREFTADDIDLYMQIRLEALETNPDAFGSTAEDFKRQPQEFYLRRLANNYESADIVFLCALDVDRPMGMIGVVRETNPKKQHTAVIVAVYVSPNARGQGVGGKLMDAIMNRARVMEGVEQLYLSVVSNNAPAIALYESRGFTRYGHAPRIKKWNNRYVGEAFMVHYF